ncbi:MAG: sterol desaturase family protein [Pseudomonadota bacterium]
MTDEATESAPITGPFTELVQESARIIWNVTAENMPNDLHWRTLLLTAALAIAIYYLRGGHGARDAGGRERKTSLLNYLLPKDIYTHVSARVDIALYAFERVLRPLWAVTLLATVAPFTEQWIIANLTSVFGASPGFEINYAWMLLYSLSILLCYDFIFYGIHYSMHKVPALWAIHKVHHSAEVLTPLTRYREHFISGPIWATGGALGYGIPAGLFAWLFNGGITQATLFNIGFFALLFGFNGSFRHYHVSFRYPRWLEKWIQSPGLHHTHHSYLKQHWDTNLAAVTSIYDRMFGTLYIPEPDEFAPWGIGPETQSEYRSFWQNTTGPFRDWYKMIRAGKTRLAESVTEPTAATDRVTD